MKVCFRLSEDILTLERLENWENRLNSEAYRIRYVALKLLFGINNFPDKEYAHLNKILGSTDDAYPLFDRRYDERLL